MDYLDELRQKLDEAEKHRANDDFPGQTDEYRWQLIVEAAVEAADRIIMEGSDGSVEETDFLTATVALRFDQKVHQAVQSKLLKAKLMARAEQADAGAQDHSSS